MAAHRKLSLMSKINNTCLEYACAVWVPYTAHDNELWSWFKIELQAG